MSEGHDLDLSDLSAVFLNCTLKPTRKPLNTEALMRVSTGLR